MKKDALSSYQAEADLLKDAVEYLEKLRPLHVKVIRVCDRYHKGYSDLFVCVQGIFVVLELKDNIGEPSAHQTLFINEILAADGIGGVCRTMHDIKSFIEEAFKRAKRT